MTKDIDYWINQATRARQAELNLWRELEALEAKSPPLTDEEIDEIVDAHTTDDGQGYDIWCDGRGVARAIEAAHGIGKKT